MVRFPTQFDARDRICTNPGTGVKQLYEARVDNNGSIDLVESGVEDLYDFIQSFKESVDINTIVKRFAAGDTDVLAKRQAHYGDFTQFPSTYAEMLDAVIRGENYFNSLPLDVRKEFNFSFAEWMSAMDDMPEWMKKMGVSFEDPAQAAPQSTTADDPATPAGNPIPAQTVTE